MPLKLFSEQGAVLEQTPILSIGLRRIVYRKLLPAFFSLTLLGIFFHEIGTPSTADVSSPVTSEYFDQSDSHQTKFSLASYHTTSAWPTDRPSQFHAYEERGPFLSLQIEGFDNTGIPGGEIAGGNLSCSSLSHTAEIGVQESFFLPDNLVDIAEGWDSHPMIDYPPTFFKNAKESFSLSSIVERTWDRLATACVFLPDHGVYLCVTRVIFHPEGRRDKSRISFLRGQIFSQSWVHLEHYKVTWKDRDILFPRDFDIPIDFKLGGLLYGPEDARIIIEDGVKDAEPVVVFNMIATQSRWRRAMWIFRPFSQHSTILTVRDMERPQKEKNWAPFFLSEHDEASDGLAVREPSNHIHFVWKFTPLTILKCGLVDGMCDIVFEQKIPDNLISAHRGQDGNLRGGTQFVPVPRSPLPAGNSGTINTNDQRDHVQAFVAFPRTHVDLVDVCKRAVYRPELVVLIANTTHFYLTYGSSAIDFGPNVVMDLVALADPCKKGRILITNSIARWDMNAKTDLGEDVDVMTLTLSVNDVTVQVTRLSGIWRLIRGLPSMKRYFDDSAKYKSDPFGEISSTAHWGEQVQSGIFQSIDPFTRTSAVGHDVRACVEEAAADYIYKYGPPPSPPKKDPPAPAVSSAAVESDKPKPLNASTVTD